MGIAPRERVLLLLGANLGRAIVTNGDLLSHGRSHLPKLLWADLLRKLTDYKVDDSLILLFRVTENKESKLTVSSQTG